MSSSHPQTQPAHQGAVYLDDNDYCCTYGIDFIDMRYGII